MHSKAVTVRCTFGLMQIDAADAPKQRSTTPGLEAGLDLILLLRALCTG